MMRSNGFGDLPVCIAKTHLSISGDASLKGAPTGHTLIHGGLSQCMHGRGMKTVAVSGNWPSTWLCTFIQAIARPMSACSGGTVATLFSLLQATSHAPQPVHALRSIDIPHR